MNKLYLYDKQESLIFPNGKTYDAEYLQNAEDYSILFAVDCAIEKMEDGITCSFYTLADLKNTYELEDSLTPQQIVDKVNELRIDQHPTQLSLSEVQGQLDALTSAFTTTEVANA